MDKCSLGIDLGGTKVELVIVSEKGEILTEERIATEAENGADFVIHNIVNKAKEMLAKSNLKPQSVGVGVAGQITRDSGEVLFAPNLKWNNVSLKRKLEESLKLPTIVLNDVRAATWAEWLHGSGQNCRDFICLFIGTGIGGGIVSDGVLLLGTSNSAGEIGHITIREDGRLCTCGNRGCLEAYAAGWGIAVTLREEAAKDPNGAKNVLSMVDGKIENLKAEHLTKALIENDPFAEKVYSMVIASLAAGCVSLVNALNPQRLIIGGGVAEKMPHLIERTEVIIRKYALKAAVSSLEVVSAKLGNKAGAIGAGAAALRTQELA